MADDFFDLLKTWNAATQGTVGIEPPAEQIEPVVDPARVQAFLAHHPETTRAMALIKLRPMTAGFAEDTFNSLNTFRLVDASGHRTSVRWSMVPASTDTAHAAASAAGDAGVNELFDELIARVHAGPLSWHLVLTIAGDGDPLDDATLAWPANRERVDVGTLTVEAVDSEEGNEVRILNFDPLILPAGIEPSGDPLLSARSASYAVSARRRLGEPTPKSAVGTAEVRP